MSNERRPVGEKMGNAGPRTLFIDSIEEGVARLVEGKEASHAFPAGLLPAGAVEGTWIEVSVRAVPAPAKAEDPAALRKRLGKSDPGGDFSL